MRYIISVVLSLVVVAMLISCSGVVPVGPVQVAPAANGGVGLFPEPKQKPPTTGDSRAEQICKKWADRIAEKYPEGGISIQDIMQGRVPADDLQIINDLSGRLCNTWYSVVVENGKISIKRKK